MKEAIKAFVIKVKDVAVKVGSAFVAAVKVLVVESVKTFVAELRK